jgi:polysaccharide export outer membrane protein
VFRKYILRLSLFSCVVGGATIPTIAQGPTADAPTNPPTVATGSGSEDSSHAQTPALQRRNRRYQLHCADVLELHFPFTAEFNQTVMVQPDGYVALRGVDSIRVVGQTLPEVTAALQAAYTKILHEPVINVELKDFEKPFFIVGGEVGHPGKFDLREDTTTSEAVAIAGGLRDSAKHSEVVLYHRVPDGWMQAKRINMKKMLKENNLNEDAFLQPGDFLYVPKNTMSKISKFLPTSSLGLYANPGVL